MKNITSHEHACNRKKKSCHFWTRPGVAVGKNMVQVSDKTQLVFRLHPKKNNPSFVPSFHPLQELFICYVGQHQTNQGVDQPRLCGFFFLFVTTTTTSWTVVVWLFVHHGGFDTWSATLQCADTVLAKRDTRFVGARERETNDNRPRKSSRPPNNTANHHHCRRLLVAD